MLTISLITLLLPVAYDHDLHRFCEMVVESPAYPAARMKHEVPDAHGVCLDVAREAFRQGAPLTLTVAVAYHETRLRRGLRGPGGEVGPMQVQPRYHCPDGKAEGCPSVRIGVAYLRDRLSRYGRFEGVGRYHGDPDKLKRTRYAGRVLGRVERFERWLRRQQG